jgi:hypothetical protein
MLTLVNNNTPCYKRQLITWAREPTEQLLHFYRAENSSVPYIRLRSSRISRARQTMEDGGLKEDDFKDNYLFPTFNSSSCYARRKSCPQNTSEVLTDFTEYLHPSEIVRPASSCGFYKKVDTTFLSPTNESPPSPTFSTSPDLSYPKNKFFSRSTELLGSVRRSVKKYTRNKMAEVPASTEPKIPSVMKSFTRGVSPEPNGCATGQSIPPVQKPSTSSEIFDV